MRAHFLGVGTGVGGLEASVQPPRSRYRRLSFQPAACAPIWFSGRQRVYLAVAGDVEMIADVGESPGLVRP